MALNVQTGTVVQPGATGSQTTSLPASFDPKALILWTVARAASGGGAGHLVYSYGWATDRGGTPVQRYVSIGSEHNIGTADCYAGSGTADIVKIEDGTTGAIDMEVAFVEFQSAAFVLDWQNLHTTGSALLNYMVIGGSDCLDALSGSFTIANAATTDVTVTAGFGQPHLVLFGISWNGSDSAPHPTTNCDTSIGFGARDAGVNGRSIRFGSNDAATTQATNQAIYADRSLAIGNGGGLDTAFQMSGSAAWPTDGFEITRNTGTATFPIPYVAIKFSANVTVTHGQGAAPTSGGLPVVQTLTSAGVPRGLLVMNARTGTATTIDASSTDCMMFGVGAVDGAGNEVWAGGSDDDAQATASVCGTYQTNAKAIQTWTSAANALDAEADGLVSGSDFQLSWNDVAPTAFLYEWIALGETGVAPAVIPDIVMAPLTH